MLSMEWMMLNLPLGREEVSAKLPATAEPTGPAEANWSSCCPLRKPATDAAALGVYARTGE